MKKISIYLLAFFVLFSPSNIFSAKKNSSVSKITSQKANVIVDGNNYTGMHVYELHGEHFFSLGEIAELLNARLEWQTVSGKVKMKLNNVSVDIIYNTKKVIFDGKKKKLYMPSILQKNEVYVPVDFMTNENLSDITESIITYEQKNKLLTLTSKTNISAVRYYTKENSTEISIELDEKMTHTIKKAKNSLIIAFQRGKIATDSLHVNNGAINDISYTTVGREAVFTVNFAQKPKLVSTKKLKNPVRLIITIDHSKPVDISKPCLVYLPSTVVSGPQIKHDIVNAANSDKDTKPKEESQMPAVDSKIIAADSVIYEVAVSSQDAAENEQLSKVKTVSVSDDQIKDDSYSIMDENSGFKSEDDPKEKNKAAKLLVLDAGHGGEDTGAVGPNGTKEKDINLAVVLMLKDLFDKDPDYNVILTRTDDTFIPLAERTNIANENKADLFVSIHNNANFKKEISGFEIYFLSEHASDSEAAATAILENSVVSLENKPKGDKEILQNMLWSMVVNEYINESSELSSFIACETPGRLKIPNRGIKQANFFVLRGTQMPAVLVEGAYLSNYGDEAKLNTKKFQSALADSIYEGVKKYYARKSKNGNGKK